MSLRDQILKEAKFPHEDVDVPEWGHKVRVTGLSAKQQDDYYTSQVVVRGGKVVGRDTTNATAKLLVRCVRDIDTGELIFGSEDIELLGEQPAVVLDGLFEIAAKLSGMTEADAEDLGKDSGQIPNGGSPSNSPASSRSARATKR